MINREIPNNVKKIYIDICKGLINNNGKSYAIFSKENNMVYLFSHDHYLQSGQKFTTGKMLSMGEFIVSSNNINNIGLTCTDGTSNIRILGDKNHNITSKDIVIRNNTFGDIGNALEEGSVVIVIN